MTAANALERLVGLQGQAPLAPYVGLWSRLDDFGPTELADSIADRSAVRATLMRATVHLVTADDALTLRSWVEPVAQRGFAASPFARQLQGIDIATLVATGRDLLEQRPRTNVEVGRELAVRWPSVDRTSMAYAVAYLLPLVQIPPRGIWGRTGPAARTTMTNWLGRPLDPDPSADDIVVRYLGAFGPASVMDAQAWSGMTRLRDVFERLRPRLTTFRDEAGRELFDLPDAPRPDPATPAPVRFLPEYDNVLLGHADRSRVIPPGRSIPLLPGNGAKQGTVLIDGLFRAIWRAQRGQAVPTLMVEPLESVTKVERDALEAEGARLLGFLEPDRAGVVTILRGAA